MALCGPPGAGKSALASALATTLPRSVRVDGDDYQQFTQLDPAVVTSWLQQDGNYDRLPMPGLIEAIYAAAAPPVDWVLFESHCGRAHSDSAAVIDFLVWIDTPLDIAMARKFQQLLSQTPAVSRPWLIDYCQLYCSTVAPLLNQQRRLVMSTADLCVDGRLSVAELSDQIISAIAPRVP